VILLVLLPDGQIAFMGRLDQQIKIRGYRIEPREITALLDPASRYCFELYRSLLPPTRGTVAWQHISWPAPDAHLNAAELRTFLGDRLPDYMVPSTFIKLTSMPTSSAWKNRSGPRFRSPPRKTSWTTICSKLPNQTLSNGWLVS